MGYHRFSNVLPTLIMIMFAVTLTKAAEAKPLEVFVSITPQLYFVEHIGGKHVSAQVLVQPGQDSHTFEPTPKQMVALGRAKLFLKMGMKFEGELLKKILGSYQHLIIVDTSAGIKKRMMAVYKHNPSNKHLVGEPDPHIWLAPPLIKIQAGNIARSFIKADPVHEKEYRKNLAVFIKNVEMTHTEVKKMLSPYKGRKFYVFHPAFGYFGDTYGLEQNAVEVEGKSPTPRQLFSLVRKAKVDNVKIIFVQPQFDRKSAMAVAGAIGGTVLPLDSMEKDVLKNIKDMAEKIVKAFKR